VSGPRRIGAFLGNSLLGTSWSQRLLSLTGLLVAVRPAESPASAATWCLVWALTAGWAFSFHGEKVRTAAIFAASSALAVSTAPNGYAAIGGMIVVCATAGVSWVVEDPSPNYLGEAYTGLLAAVANGQKPNLVAREFDIRSEIATAWLRGELPLARRWWTSARG